MPAHPEVLAYVRQRAAELGIDPNVAEAVSRSEALNVFDPNKPDLGGDDRSSFGPFQLHYGGLSKKMPRPGLGDAFTKATGLHASDPSTWRQQVDFALNTAKQDGWRQWMGAANTGIGRWAGIRQGADRLTIDKASANTRYDPRSDTPSTAQPTGSTLPGPPPAATGTPLTPEQATGQPAAQPLPPFPTTVASNRKTLSDIMGGAVANMGPSPEQVGMGRAPQAPQTQMTSLPAMATVDPGQQNMKRQQLAMLMQRLNQGNIW
jgi:hypothetical protein